MRFGTPTYGFYKTTILVILLPFIAIFPLILMFFVSISPMLQQYLIKDVTTSLELLQACETWYKIILIDAMALAVLIIAVIVTHIVLLVRFRDDITVSGLIQSIVLEVVTLGFVSFIGIAMITSEKVPTLLKNVQQDIRQVENGQLEVSEVWLNDRITVEGMPGPFAGQEVEVMTQYRGIGESTNNSWTSFYVPTCIPFQPNTESMFNEYKSIEWNTENTAMYRIHHTSNMKIVTEIEKIQ